MSFADNSSTNSTELFDQFIFYSGETFQYIMVSLSFFSIVLFPFYAYLNIINRPQDSQRAVFPFLNFFYKVTCLSVVVYVYALSYLATAVIKKNVDSNFVFLRTPLFAIGLLILAFIVLPVVINTPVCQLLTSFLAFHRFLLYFFPKVGDFLTPGKKATRISICLLYAVVLVGFFILQWITESKDLEEFVNFFDTSQISERGKYMIIIQYCAGLGLSELLISIPYTFMILSIRKLTHLASAIQSRPEKYIAYQIVITFFFKLISFVNAIFTSYPKKENLTSLVQWYMIFDVFTFPLSVQLAYILSNKKNVDTLIAVITGKLMFWKNRARVEVENSTRF